MLRKSYLICMFASLLALAVAPAYAGTWVWAPTDQTATVTTTGPITGAASPTITIYPSSPGGPEVQVVWNGSITTMSTTPCTVTVNLTVKATWSGPGPAPTNQSFEEDATIGASEGSYAPWNATASFVGNSGLPGPQVNQPSPWPLYSGWNGGITDTVFTPSNSMSDTLTLTSKCALGNNTCLFRVWALPAH